MPFIPIDFNLWHLILCSSIIPTKYNYEIGFTQSYECESHFTKKVISIETASAQDMKIIIVLYHFMLSFTIDWLENILSFTNINNRNNFRIETLITTTFQIIINIIRFRFINRFSILSFRKGLKIKNHFKHNSTSQHNCYICLLTVWQTIKWQLFDKTFVSRVSWLSYQCFYQ